MKVKQKQRELAILQSLKKFDYLTRSQIQTIHRLKSDRNAQRVLKNMSEYLNVDSEGEYIYFLNAKGREAVNSDVIRYRKKSYTHYIMRNQLYIECGYPATWQNEIRIKHPTKPIQVIADAIFQREGKTFIVEIDHTQRMIKNRHKIEKYRQLRSVIPNPYWIWATTTEHRRKQIEKFSKGLNISVYIL